ncbi:PREDICTED: cytochrome b561 and DOMON domain-containing protein At5g47530-like [Camelina sativa]|uniref:Cytochrome b561 and DOMON domain-containing protein n=1 Tax=Camelina sativa TaxID=90675 RepID=A0ABM0X634_CAMSA|nr:PREDICTED: cytochrome b561 and DOMON domain-containing protein At5g47530-like [Camelina sativa]
MAKSLNLLLCLSVLICIIAESALAQTCSNYKFSSNRLFKSCNDLSVLDSFLHYSYDSSSGNLQIAYRHTKFTTGKWVAWAVNPTSTGMVGAQAIVAYPQSDGTVRAYTSPISSYQTSLQEAELSFNVSELSATYQNNEMVIFATLNLPLANGWIINTVWQDGSLSGNNPLPHPTSGNNVGSVSTMNLVSGASGSTSTSTGGGGGGGGDSKLRKRNIHGILNGVSWGVMMPIGAIIARYLKVSKSADPAWFYLHVFCQSSAYIIGVSDWATGLKLGRESAGIQFTTHRAVGIALFCLATIQVFAMFLRPKPEHKYRVYWNIYHHTIGYTVIILALVNVFKGLDILSPAKQWRNAYTGIIVVLGIAAAVLEAFTWYVVIKRGKTEESAKMGQRVGNDGRVTL